MIVEFLGLPGAGKSSLERALITEIKRRGWKVMSRAEAVEALALQCSPFPRDRAAVFRRLSTLCFKLSILRECLAINGGLLVWGDLMHFHRMRAAMRLVEDLRLHRLGRSALKSGHILNLSEGLAQHLVALSAWRVLLGAAGRLDLLRHCASTLFSPNSILVHVIVPESVAAARLHDRGLPALWPATVAPLDVLKAFAEGVSSLSAFFSVNESVRIERVNGNLAQPDWYLEAVSIANHLPPIVMNDQSEQHKT